MKPMWKGMGLWLNLLMHARNWVMLVSLLSCLPRMSCLLRGISILVRSDFSRERAEFKLWVSRRADRRSRSHISSASAYETLITQHYFTSPSLNTLQCLRLFQCKWWVPDDIEVLNYLSYVSLCSPETPGWTHMCKNKISWGCEAWTVVCLHFCTNAQSGSPIEGPPVTKYPELWQVEQMIRIWSKF